MCEYKDHPYRPGPGRLTSLSFVISWTDKPEVYDFLLPAGPNGVKETSLSNLRFSTRPRRLLSSGWIKVHVCK